MKQKEIKLKLTLAFNRAKLAADAAIVGHQDDGTCNMDTPSFRIPGVQAKTLKEAALAAGVTVTEFNSGMGPRSWWLMLSWAGQANLRSRQMEAALKSLREDPELKDVPGFQAWGWYQMD